MNRMLKWAEAARKRTEVHEATPAQSDDKTRKSVGFEVAKVDDQLGLVFGYAIVCKVDGEDYFDVQGDHIPEDSMLEASLDFMLHSRVGKEMHRGDQAAGVVFAFPLTEDIAKSMGIQASQTGLMIAYKPASDEVLEKFRDGTYTGFSIGGRRIEDEEVE